MYMFFAAVPQLLLYMKFYRIKIGLIFAALPQNETKKRCILVQLQRKIFQEISRSVLPGRNTTPVHN
jgi:hypothetical protein